MNKSRLLKFLLVSIALLPAFAICSFFVHAPQQDELLIAVDNVIMNEWLEGKVDDSFKRKNVWLFEKASLYNNLHILLARSVHILPIFLVCMFVASLVLSRHKKDIPTPFNLFRDSSKRVELDQNLDWDRSTLQSIYISGKRAEFVVEVPLLTFHKLFSHDPAYLHKIQQVRATISFPNVFSIKTTFLDMETNVEDDKREFEELWNVYKDGHTYIVNGPDFEYRIVSAPMEFEICPIDEA